MKVIVKIQGEPNKEKEFRGVNKETQLSSFFPVEDGSSFSYLSVASQNFTYYNIDDIDENTTIGYIVKTWTDEATEEVRQLSEKNKTIGFLGRTQINKLLKKLKTVKTDPITITLWRRPNTKKMLANTGKPFRF